MEANQMPNLEKLQTGESLPELELPITTTLIVSGAIASRDFQEVHHDRAIAQERGTPDIFMNILTTNGLVGRYVTDWAGPRALLRTLSIQLGVPNYPGGLHDIIWKSRAHRFQSKPQRNHTDDSRQK